MIPQLIISVILIIVSSIYIFLVIFSPKASVPSESESTYLTNSSPTTPLPLSSIHAPATLELSVIIPAYNERDRLGIMLREAVEYLETCSLIVESDPLGKTEQKEKMRRVPTGIAKGSYEILIVDDGSRDGTSAVALELASELEKRWSSERATDGTVVPRPLRGVIKVVKLIRNRGKGGCVKHGILHAAGNRILFVDADGASHFPDLKLLQDELNDLETFNSEDSDDHSVGGHGLVVGSRAHLVSTEAVVKRSFVRNLLMRFFHTYLYILGIRSIRDTQCGFKLHTRRTASHIYPLLHSPSWIFDCELLLLAAMANIPTGEVGIKWQEVGGSKVDLIKDSIAMAIDLLVIRGNYLCGRWKTPEKID